MSPNFLGKLFYIRSSSQFVVQRFPDFWYLIVIYFVSQTDEYLIPLHPSHFYPSITMPAYQAMQDVHGQPGQITVRGIFRSFCTTLSISVRIQGRIQGGGVQGVRTPRPLEIICGFLIQQVFTSGHQSVMPFVIGALPPKRNRGSAPGIY